MTEDPEGFDVNAKPLSPEEITEWEWDHVANESRLLATIRGLEAENRELADAVEYAWTIICNAGEGDWTRESAEWQGAADRFRTQYHEKILPLLTLKPEAPL